MHLAFPTACAPARGAAGDALFDAMAAAENLAQRLATTSARYGFDRFWRNARVHMLHDPVDCKLRDLERYALEGRVPDPSAYS